MLLLLTLVKVLSFNTNATELQHKFFRAHSETNKQTSTYIFNTASSASEPLYTVASDIYIQLL